MKHILTVNYEDKPIYDIVIQPDYSSLADSLTPLHIKERKVMIITDSNVAKYHLEECKRLLEGEAKSVFHYIIPAGEANKNLDTVNHCYEQLIENGFDRNDVLFALGGGVVGDLTGFVAATYLRGIRFIQLPTTLLSMVDSSIGGKTGVDLNAYKNMVGAFHQPILVYINLSTLMTLHENEYYSGMGEIIKHGLIKDSAYFHWLQNHITEIKNKDYDIVSEMILRSCQIKKDVVEKDPKELGERALLNYGHTIGHSIEKLMNFELLHGECVSIGMAAAAYISLQRGYLQSNEYEDILHTISSFHQPISINNISVQEIYEVTKLDKKMDANQIKFILLKEIGHAVIDSTVTKDEMIAAIQSVIK